MILENYQLLESLLQENSLQIKTQNHKRTWEYYHGQYHKAFYVFLKIASQKNYYTNCKFMPFLFIMRHSIELFLKVKISNTTTPWELYGKTHNLTNLHQLADIKERQFLEFLSCLNCNSEGDCWRYLADKEGNLYFDSAQKINALDACIYYCSLMGEDNSLTKSSNDKNLQWELTFHTGECNTLGHIGTQYDYAIRDILLAIQSKQISINDVYLPLLFLMRHSLEVKLKSSIMSLGNIVDKEYSSKVNHTHSVKFLYDILANYIDNPIESITDQGFKKQTKDLRYVTKQYKDIIASLDNNSFLFRFPKDRMGNNANFIPKSDCVSKTLELYWNSDLFLCFVVEVLFENGVLEIGNDKQREYYE